MNESKKKKVVRKKQRTTERIKETMSWFFGKKINNLHKPLVKLTKSQRDSIQFKKIGK